jgi:pyruvate dehydrogenase E1 component alpha subunit
VPAILFCRNNGWAISVPASTQSATPSFAQKAIAYGMPGVLVDGNDLLAVIHVVAEAAARARRGEGPTLIEARTYRRGAHSTSDDPSVYRDPAEPRAWERRDPIDRIRGYAMARGELDAAFEAKAREEINAEIRAALAHAEGRPGKPPLASLVEDVYAEPTPRLREELAALEAEIAKHGPKRPAHG